MRRRHHLALTVAVVGALAFGAGAAQAIVGDHPIELNPATPQAGESFTASGDDCDALQYATSVRNILTGNAQNGVDTAPVGGHWTTDFAADWDDAIGPGWQVVGVQCDPDGEDWTSATFFVPGATPVLPITIQLGEDDGDNFATGAGCPTDTVLLRDITDDFEGFGGDTPVNPDGTWSFNIGSSDPTNFHLIAGCVDDTGNTLEQLYEYGGTTTPVDPGTPDSPGASGDPASAPAAQSVVTQPALTG
jgi:hypothetical protein